MEKIIKYEWRKQRTSRLIILGGLLVFILSFAVALFTGNETAAVISVILNLACSFLVIFYTGIESLLVFNRDLRTKQSHMLWMIPKSIWEILGGKFISAIFQMFFMFAAFTITGVLCLALTLTKFSGINAMFSVFKQIMQNLFGGNFDWWIFTQVSLALFAAWTLIIMTGFLAIIISRTLFLNSRFSGLFSFILFFVINGAVEKGYNILSQVFKTASSSITVWDILYYGLAGGILFLTSGLLADKKLSV